MATGGLFRESVGFCVLDEGGVEGTVYYWVLCGERVNVYLICIRISSGTRLSGI